MDQQGKNNKKDFHRGDRFARGERKPFGRDGERKPFNRDGERKPFGRDGERKPFNRDGERKPFNRDGERKPYNRDGERKPFGRDGERKPYNRDGERKPYNRDGERKPFGRPAPKPHMPPQPSARDVALKALRNVFRDNAYASQALDRELSAVHLSDEDRRLTASMFYFTLENRLRIQSLISTKVQSRPDPEIMDILTLAAAQILFMDKIPDHAAVDEAVKQTRKARRESMTALVNAVLRGLIRDRDEGLLALPDRELEPEKYISEKYSVSLPLVERLTAAYGVDLTEQIVSWTPDRRSETIRANHLQMSDAQFEVWLSAQNFSWEKAVVPDAYRVMGAGRLAAHEGYRKGLFSIQGESSMLAALAMEVKPGMQVLDACAAPGGKSCLMAEKMGGSGRVHAWDLHEHRVELIKAAARRLHLDNIRPAAHDASKFNANLEGMMDAVLVDAPCSGVGVMGDKPDIKYRLTPDTIDALVPIQQSILETCARYVRPGGLLVYSTCTILPEENQAQVELFMKNHPEFEMETDTGYLPEALRPGCENGMIQLLPCREGLDGFFIARMRRKAGC